MSFLIAALKAIPGKQAGRVACLLIVLIALAVIGSQQPWWPTGVSPLGWGVGLLFLGVLALLVFLLRYLSRARERRFLACVYADDAASQDDSVAAHTAQLQANLQAAMRLLHSAPTLHTSGTPPLYALPWYLLLGASQSGKTTLLRGVARDDAPLLQPDSPAGATQACDWWLFNTAIVLDTTGVYAFPTETEHAGEQWYHFLHVLRRARPLSPINGLLLTVGADTLAGQPDTILRQQATQLRKRIDEAMRTWGVDFPVYVLVTRCDVLEGFTEFFDCVPAPLTRQVFGYVQEARPPAPGQPPPSAVPGFAAMFASLVERLQHLRLAIYNQETLPAAALRQKIGCFPEEFQALGHPLQTFVETLFRANPYQHTPFWRGIFFCSAQQQGTPLSFLRRAWDFAAHDRTPAADPTPYFVHDLVTHILPRDQHLVRVTGTARRGRLWRHLAGLVVCLGLCLGLLGGLTQAFLSDWRLYAAVDPTPCLDMVPLEAHVPRLEGMARCQQIVHDLEELGHQRPAWHAWLFHRSDRLRHALRQRYVTTYATAVLNPLDTRLAQHLQSDADAMPLVFLLIQRLELLTHCLTAGASAPSLAQERPLDYPRLLAPASSAAPEPQQVALLQSTYAAYLRWAVDMPEVLQREQAAHTERLQQWFAATEFAPAQLLHWANQHHAPVTLQAYWRGLPPGGSHATVQVEGAYTRAAWQESLRPFLERAAAAVPSLRPRLDTFHATYRAHYLAQWHQFLSAFPGGEQPWVQTPIRRRQLAVSLLQADAPYQRILDDIVMQLQPFLPASSEVPAPPEASTQGAAARLPPGQAQPHGTGANAVSAPTDSTAGPAQPGAAATVTLPAWVQVVQRYVTSESRQAYQQALSQLHESLADDPSREKSFQLAQRGFQEGKPGQASAHPLLKARGIVEHVRATTAAGEASEAVVWPLLERPLRLAWNVMVHEAGVYLQTRWVEEVLVPLQGLAALDQLHFLYGPQGQVGAFVTHLVQPFLRDNATRPRQMLGEELALFPTFLASLQQARQLQPLLAQQAPQPVTVEMTQVPVIDSVTNLRHELTEWRLECASKTFTMATPAPTSPALATTVLWSFAECHDAVITIVLSCDRRCVEGAAVVGMAVPETAELRLSKHYPGQAGLVHFLQDFRDGTQTFSRADFATKAPSTTGQGLEATLHRYGLQSIRVFYRVDVPRSLTTLVALLPGPIPPRIIE
jgi:type VI secretion system protein ImpL